jgi:hypothetical protein
MPSDTSLIVAPRPFDPAGDRPPCCVTGDLSRRRKGGRCAFKRPYRKGPGPRSRDEDEDIWANGAAEVGLSSRRKFTHNPCKGIAGSAILQRSRADYEKSLLAFFWRASIVSMYGIGP